jgi:hypothetical protein
MLSNSPLKTEALPLNYVKLMTKFFVKKKLAVYNNY